MLGNHPLNPYRKHNRDNGGKPLRNGRHRKANGDKKHFEKIPPLKRADGKDKGTDAKSSGTQYFT